MLEILTNTLADAAKPDTTISGEWVLALVGVIISSMIAGLMGKAWGKKQAEGMRLEEPVPEIPTRMRKVSQPPSWDQHAALERRVGVIEQDVKQLSRDQAEQFKDLLEAGQERERRLADKMDSQTRELHGRLDDQFGPRPVRRKGGA